MNRPHSASNIPRKLNMNNQKKIFITPNYLPNMENSPKMNNYLKEESYDEELGLLQLAWDELGITTEYRAVFINILRNANDIERINIFNQEKNNIKKFKDSLVNLKKEIENRENNLTKLKKLNFMVQNMIRSGEEINTVNQILQSAISLIKNLRINAVNIVKKVSKVNQLITYYIFAKKFNMKKLNPEYAYDPQYLFKMKDDLKFLKNSALSTFIEMNNSEIDPFLTCCDSSQLGLKGIKGNKIIIPIPDDVMKLIIESRYELLQETVFNNMEKDTKENFVVQSNDNNDMNLINKYSNYSNNNNTNKYEGEKFKLKMKNSFNSAKNYKQNSFKNNFIQSTKGNNVSRYLHILKNSGKIKYDNYFFKKRNYSPLISKKPLSSKLRKNSNDNKNKIVIIHEEIESLKHDQFMKRLSSIQNLDNDERKNESIMDQKEERKVCSEYRENIDSEVFELKTRIKKMENKAQIEMEKRENAEKKNKELLFKMKRYQNELEQISQMKKKKENELNKKIELLQKELLILKNHKEANNDDTVKKIRNLENNFLNEENLRKNKEIIIGNLEQELKEQNIKYNQLNEEKNEIEKKLMLSEENNKRINERNQLIEEENQKLKDDIKNLQEAKREQDNILKEKELLINEKDEENNKITSEKNIIEKEKCNNQNEFDKLKEEYNKQNDELEKLKQKIKLLEENNEKLKKQIEEKNNTNDIEILSKDKLEYKNEINNEIKNLNQENDDINKEDNNSGRNRLISLEEKINNNSKEIDDKNSGKESNNANIEEVSDNNFQVNDNKNNNLINVNYLNPNRNENNKNNNNDKEIIISENLINIKDSSDNTILKNPQNQIHNYSVDYYRGNLYNLLTEINSTITLDDIPDFLKRAFALDDTIFAESFYFKGIFPKILISQNIKENNKITGMCSFHYESTENLNENLTIRINSFIVDSNYEEQIIEMINFIKNKVDFDKIMLYILYDRKDDKFVPNLEAKELFEKKLKFKWFCVVKDEKLNQRYIKYCFNKKEIIYDPYNNETTMAENALRHNKNNFLINNVTIASINQEQNLNLLNNNFKNKFGYNKFINPNLIYFILLQNKNLKIDFNNQSKKDELLKMMEKSMKYCLIESNYGNSDIPEIKHLDEEIEQSIYKEIKEYLKKNYINCVPNLLRTKLSINFETNYSTIIDDLYYNRISSDKISIFEEEKSGSRFYLIPSKDNNTLFYISEINNKLKDLLIDGTKNIYEKFLEYQPSTQKQIFEFSLKSIRDVSYIPLTPRKTVKTILIPCFSVKSHLFSYDFKDVKKEVNMKEMQTEIPLNLTSVEEFIKVEFKPDNNINNSFSTIEGNDFFIKNPFVIGIFDNDIINNVKLPLLQFLYITQDNFLTVNNYRLDNSE